MKSLLCALLAVVAIPALAQESAAICGCDAKGGKLVIRYTPDVENAKWSKSPAPIRFMSLLVLDEETKTMVEDSKSKVVRCRLGADRFEVTLEPGVPNVNLLGRCGAAVTGTVTVKRNGAVVLDEQEFEDLNCHERKRYLKTITFRAGSAKPQLVFAEYEN